MDRYGRNGVNQMNCVDCPLKYVEQTGRTFYTRFKVHIQAIRNNNIMSGYSNSILSTGNAYGSITDATKIMETEERYAFEYIGEIPYI
jgi:hypothetical protein